MTTKIETKTVLADNLNRLMACNLSLSSNPKLAKRSGVGLGTVARVRNADVSVNLDTNGKAVNNPVKINIRVCPSKNIFRNYPFMVDIDIH